MAEDSIERAHDPREGGAEAPRARVSAVVGVGSGAVSQASLETLFSHLPRDLHAAWVVVRQGRGTTDADELARVLGRCSGLPTAVATQGVELRPDHVYVSPPGRLLTLVEGRLHIEPAAHGEDERGLIDTFLMSMVEGDEAHGVAVLLAGLGSDGVMGVLATKECGGLALAERDEEAPQPEGPLTNATALADFAEPVAAMPGRIAGYVRHLQALEAQADLAGLAQQAAQRLKQIATILRNVTGHDFHGYKHNTFTRRIQRRMQVTQIDDVEAYLELLRAEPDEVRHLFQDLLIGVTQFFRDKPEFALLEREIIPRILDGKGTGDPVRVWVLGCATGEEAYSLGMLIREEMARRDVIPHVQIFATDIDGRALAAARAGRYPLAIARDLTPERLARWFVREGDTYQVIKELREICIFSQHNVVRDAPFSRTDLISCRNLLIYLDTALQDRVIPLFHFSLKPDGYLFLGPSENVTRHAKLFAPVDRKHRMFRRLETAVRVLPKFPLTAIDRSDLLPDGAAGQAGVRRARSLDGLGRQAERIAERYAPAYVVIDQHYEVLHFSGRTGRYLEPTPGAATLNLLSLVHRDLRVDLRAALQGARTQGGVVKLDRVPLGPAGEGLSVNMVVEPITPGNGPTSFVVLFSDAGPAGADGPSQSAASVEQGEYVQRLDAELRLTRERLQATIEELETTNEELKSSNEEYQSVNEEMQSVNEELETSKEELQSINEELQTVNGEMALRVADLARSNSDLKNLLESTQIGTIFLDTDLRVRTFTPSATDVFPLAETDLERPIAHIASRVAYPELQDDARRVLRALTPVQREVGDPSTGSRYLVRVLPYRSTDNYIAGVVLTFLDMTATVAAERALRASEERLKVALTIARLGTWELEPQTGALSWSQRTTEILGVSSEEAGGMEGWRRLLHPPDRERVVAEAAAMWADPQRSEFESAFRIRRPDGEVRWIGKSGRITRDAEGRAIQVAAVMSDDTQARNAERRTTLLMGELQHRVKNILAVVRSLAARTLENSGSLEEFGAHFDGRLATLARTQSVIARGGEGDVELDELVREELLSHAAREGEQVQIDGEPIRLKQKAAELVGLALHELAVNAVKYGALSTPKGRITVSWRVFATSSGERLSIDWRESGVALVSTEPSRVGFGLEMIRNALPYELGAATSLEFSPGGIRCMVELPITDLLVVRPGTLDYVESSSTPHDKDGSDVLAGRRVLVVEDHYLVADDLRRMLVRLGAEVLGPAANLEQALEIIGSGEVELALLDVNLDDHTAYPAIDALQALGTPYVIASGYEPQMLPERYRTAPRVAKPVTPQALLETIRRRL